MKERRRGGERGEGGGGGGGGGGEEEEEEGEEEGEEEEEEEEGEEEGEGEDAPGCRCRLPGCQSAGPLGLDEPARKKNLLEMSILKELLGPVQAEEGN